MIKNTFTITAMADGTVHLSQTPFFNKLESGITKLVFTLPDMQGFKYLLARHDHREWFAIPILEDEKGKNYILIGQTVTQFHGRWAFNVCITDTDITQAPRKNDAVYMSDVFEGLVYDNISDIRRPSTAEPNALKIGSDCKYWYERLKAMQDEIENNLINTQTGLDNIHKTVEEVKKYGKDSADIRDEVEAFRNETEVFRDEAEAYRDDANAYKDATSDYARQAADYTTLAKSWAIGKTGLRTDEDIHNAFYYAELAGRDAQLSNVYEQKTAEHEQTVDAYRQEAKDCADEAAKYYSQIQRDFALGKLKGEKGEKGEKGDSGIAVMIQGTYMLAVEDGELYVIADDGTYAPTFEIDANGDLYLVEEI